MEVRKTSDIDHQSQTRVLSTTDPYEDMDLTAVRDDYWPFLEKGMLYPDEVDANVWPMDISNNEEDGEDEGFDMGGDVENAAGELEDGRETMEEHQPNGSDCG